MNEELATDVVRLADDLREVLGKWGPRHDVASCKVYVCPSCAVEACREDVARTLAEVWDGRIAPGGWVCRTCGMPTESEPCAAHNTPALPTSEAAE